MKKNTIILFLLCLTMQGFAQKDTTVMRVCYVEEWKRTNITNRDHMELWVGNRFSKFFSQSAIRSQQVLDSVNKATKGDPDLVFAYLKKSQQAPSEEAGQHYKVYKHLTTDTTLTYTTPYCDPKIVYKYEEPICFNWELSEKSDSVIAGYHCQKAITYHRGHTWIAWYAPDIPIDDGPWKLCGLPGLILQAESADGSYRFMCKEIHPNVHIPFEFEKQPYRKVSPKELYRLMHLDLLLYLHEVKGVKLPLGYKPKDMPNGGIEEY